MFKRKEGFDGERALIVPHPVVAEMEKDPYTSMLHITDIGYYPKAMHHYRMRSEPINQHILIYCMEGAGWFKLDNHEYKVEPDQYFILPAGQPHEYGSNETTPWTIYWIHFKGKLASTFTTGKDHPIDIRPGIHSRISDRITLFEEIFRTLEMGYSRENMQYASTVFHHYLGTLHNIQQYRNATRNHEQQVDIVTASIHYMQENIEKKLTLEQLAAYSGYCASHYGALFGKRTGYTPLAYFNQLKIQRACNLLDFTEMKINQISYKIGMDDTFYFSRLFSKTMGMSPSEYRKLKKG